MGVCISLVSKPMGLFESEKAHTICPLLWLIGLPRQACKLISLKKEFVSFSILNKLIIPKNAGKARSQVNPLVEQSIGRRQ